MKEPRISFRDEKSFHINSYKRAGPVAAEQFCYFDIVTFNPQKMNCELLVTSLMAVSDLLQGCSDKSGTIIT